MRREETRDNLIELLEPLVESRGFELIHLEYVTGKQGSLHLYIDHEKGIAIEHCEQISRAVSEMLDLRNPITHAYTLEVSSPGLERPLTKKKHFIRFQGEKIKIKTGEAIEGNSKFCGTLQQAGELVIEIAREDGSMVEVPYALIARAIIWYKGPENIERIKK